MSAAVRLLPADIMDPQTLALTANAFARAAAEDAPLFRHLAAAALAVDPGAFEPSTAAYLLNALARHAAAERSRPRPPHFVVAGSGGQPSKRGRQQLVGLSGFDGADERSARGGVKIVEVLRAESVVDWWSEPDEEMDVAGLAQTMRAGHMGKRLSDENGGSDGEPATKVVDGLFGTVRADVSRKAVDGSGMSDEELKALADYLISEPPRINAGGDTIPRLAVI